MRWNSPWGWGAPGWHLECSVMSMALLGEHFDIHTGGVDHRELHHVNEIAQCEAFLHDGQPWVRYWLHNEFLLLNNAKIAKSSGPVPRLADLVEAGYHPMAYRLFLLGGHYRSQLDFTTAAIDAAQATLRRLVARVAALPPAARGRDLRVGARPGRRTEDKAALAYVEAIDAAISDRPRDAEAARHPAGRAARPGHQRRGPARGGGRRRRAARPPPRRPRPGEVDRRRSAADLAPEEVAAIERLIAERTQARKERNWARADEIRAELDALGVQVTDTPAGPTWELR